MMDPTYLINYLIFAAFLTLFALEIGVATLSLLSVEDYRAKLASYITPIWEVNGTFIVFYLVNFEVSYPSLLYMAGTIYITIALLGGLILILRNSFLAYSEYISGDTGRRFLRIYAVSTIIVAFLALSILSSSVSGIGINPETVSINILAAIFNPFNILMFVSVALITLFVSSNTFNIARIKRYSAALLLLALAIVYLILREYVPYTLSGALGAPMLAFYVLTAIVAGLSLTSFKYTGYISIAWFFIAVVMFGVLEYPFIFGGKVDITQYITTSTMAGAALPITVIGGSMVIASLAYLIYINYAGRGRRAYGKGAGLSDTAGDKK